MRRTFLTLLAVVWLSGNAWAAQFHSFEVSQNNGRYQLSADIYLAAPLPQVYQVLTDYNHLTRISGAILQSRMLKQTDAHTYLVFVESRACVLFFCHNIKETQRVMELTPREVVSEVIPEGSNVKNVFFLLALGPGRRRHAHALGGNLCPGFLDSTAHRSVLYERRDAGARQIYGRGRGKTRPRARPPTAVGGD
ncbi:MAG TPA: hypothetical protein VNF46_02595 [Gammaproteobacteria bacterium]|nr:hypothetical protein [Gammaproteobacteria bacterium]